MLLFRILKAASLIFFVVSLCQHARGDTIYDVTLNTTPLVGHPAGPFYVELAVTDGSGVGDGNNTVSLSSFFLGGGSALGSPFTFGGVSGSLENGVTITDTSFLNVFSEQFTPGLQLSFSVDMTSNDDLGGIPDGLTLYILDSSGVPLPTLAPFGDYFLGADISSSGPNFSLYGSDPSRAPSDGNPVTIAAPTITPMSTVPEPSSISLVCAPLVGIVLIRSYGFIRFPNLKSRRKSIG